MTPRETEVLGWVQKGLSNKQIAKRLGIAENTVKMHITGLFKEYAVRTRHQLALYSLGNTVPVMPTLEVEPYCWIKHTSSFTGVSMNNCPDDSWVAVYKKDFK